ncbi:MAG: chorismate synthase [Lachnospiraceae bacterium]|nr:chorismate synthase [Lachnospiraceae bacterium]
MKNTIGNSLTITIFGESHGEAIGCVLDGVAPGIAIDDECIKAYLSKRRPSGLTDTKRCEPDNYKIVSGVFEGKTTGTPICIIIPNEDKKSADYNFGPARPSHADYAAHVKYHGFEDYRGGGHFSGRITAALVAAGGILLPQLEKLGIFIGTHILKCSGIEDLAFNPVNPSKDIKKLKDSSFPVLDEVKGQAMVDEIEKAKNTLDSVGGIIQTAVTGLPSGVGEPWFDSVESQLSHAIFSIGAVKGVEFGAGFEGTSLKGSEFNDSFIKGDGKIVTKTNNNGGINGGITNGMPILFNTAVKPTPSISKPQQTVNFLTGNEEELVIKGRHDPAIIRRICPVIDSMTAIIIADMLCCRYGTDVLTKGEKLWNMD